MSLGIEDGRIQDSAMTASTIHNSAYVAHLGRLTWCLGLVRQEPGVQRQVTTKNGCRSILEIPLPSLR